MIIWVLSVGTDHHRDDLVGVYSSPELAVAAAAAAPKPVAGGQSFELEARRVDSDEVLPSFIWKDGRMGWPAEGWHLEYDGKSWRGTDAGVGYMLALCEVPNE